MIYLLGVKHIMKIINIMIFTLLILSCSTSIDKKKEKKKFEFPGNVVITKKQEEKIDSRNDPNTEIKDKSSDKKTESTIIDDSEQLISNNKDFLQADENAEEIFRVLVSSNFYIVSQMKFANVILRAKDTGGDEYIIDEIKRLDKISETREGYLTIWLFPDTGSIMKVRPQRPSYIVEIDKLLTDDIQRWNFVFPKKVVYPTRFDIKYKIILRKTQTDEQIIKEIQKKLRDSQ